MERVAISMVPRFLFGASQITAAVTQAQGAEQKESATARKQMFGAEWLENKRSVALC